MQPDHRAMKAEHILIAVLLLAGAVLLVFLLAPYLHRHQAGKPPEGAEGGPIALDRYAQAYADIGHCVVRDMPCPHRCRGFCKES